MEKYNFGAGPAVLPKEVFEEAAKNILNFDNSGLSILEISHRSKEFKEVLEEAKSLVCELLDISEDYSVLFLHGGATLNFITIPMNFLGDGASAGYVDTGVWAEKARKQAKLYGNIEKIASSFEEHYTYIPKDFEINENLSYVHITSNNTIYGTQYKAFPETMVPLVADMSSDIFSRHFDMRNFALVYAGFQKNLGPAGGSIVIVNKDFLNREVKTRNIPPLLRYSNNAVNDSLYNTPPVFSIYATMLNLRWLKKMGGIAKIEEVNEEKAKLLYGAIEQSSYFETVCKKEDRSNMNVCFRAKDEDIEKDFLRVADENGIIGIKGHRSVGGFRASIYNACSLENVRYLSDLIKSYQPK